MVEKMLLDLPEVGACCVITYGQEGSEKYIVAFIVLDSEYCNSITSSIGGKPDQAINFTRIIRSKLKDRLPIYMIPAKFLYLEKYVLHFLYCLF